MSPTTLEDTLDMAKEGWAYPNLSYQDAMAMLQELKFPEILGKELDDCVVAWKETRKTQTMFNPTSTQEDSLKFATETEFFKHTLTAKYIQQNAPSLDRPLKEISPASLEKYLRECMKYGNIHGMHYRLWFILFGTNSHLKPYSDKVKRAAATYPKYDQVLEKMASFWAMSLKCYVSQDIDYDAKRREFLKLVKLQILKGEFASAIVYLRSEADTLKTYNPNYPSEAQRGGMTEEMQKKGTEREIRSALLSLLANDNAPLEHIWQEMVQSHLRENPSGSDRGESSVKNIEIDELITCFKNACDMLGFMKDKGKKAPPSRIFNSNTKPTKEGNTSSRKKRCDKCKVLDTPCSPELHHCKESGHQKGKSPTDSSPKAFYTTKDCIHCLTQLQRNIAKTQREPQPTPLIPPLERKINVINVCT